MPTEIRLPQLAEGMEQARLAVWIKREGDVVAAGEPIAEVETDKTNVELEAPASGILRDIRVAAGTDGVAVGSILAVIVEAEDAQQRRVPPAIEPELTATPGPTLSPASDETSGPELDSRGTRPLVGTPSGTPADATPLAARMAALAGLDLSTLAGRGRVTKATIDGVLSRATGTSPRPEPAATDPAPPSGGFEERPLTAMRRVTAARLQHAKQTIPHFYLSVDCAVDALVALRSQLAARTDAKVTVTDLLVFASAQALRAVPEANAAWAETAIRVYESVDIAVAVETPRGLVAPVVRGCHRKTLGVISSELRELAARAREGRLKPEEYAGGTFTISNLGMFGVTGVVPIVNPPQCCILGVGALRERAAVVDGRVVAGWGMTCTLAADHRVIDGAAGARLLAEIRRFLEQPVSLAFGV